MKKAVASEVMLATFAIIVALLIATFIVPKVGVPTMETYGKKQASIAAQTLAASINALGASEEGEVVKYLNGEWDVSVAGDEIRVAHEQFEGRAKLLVDTVSASLSGVRSITIRKEEGEPIGIS